MARMYRSVGTALLVAAVTAACGSTVSLTGSQSAGSLSGGLSASTGETPSGGAPTDLGAPGEATPSSSSASSLPSDSPTEPGSNPSTDGATGGSTGQSGASISGIAATGRGWDAKSVYIGVPTADDFNNAEKALGANFDNGNEEGDVNAILADINKSGGLFGRKVVAVYKDINVVQAEANPAAAAQTICTYFTQDKPVMAVISPAPQFDSSASFHACFEKYSVPVISLTNTAFSDKDYLTFGPHLWTVGSLSTDLLVPSFLEALQQQGFFSGWNTTTGTVAKTPAKVGLLLPDDPQGRYVESLMTSGLKQMGINVAADFLYDPSGMGSASQSEVLKFQAAGVTHVLDLPPVELEITDFQSAAQQQHYRPRYGLTFFDLPITVEENPGLAPTVQQIGSMGIGWQPYNDTDAAHDPGPTSGSKQCLAVLAKGGQTFDSAHRRAGLVALGLCDGLYLIRDGAAAGKGFTGANFLTGIGSLGTSFLTAATFQGNLSSTNHGVPGFYRDLQYVTSCSCFQYFGPEHAFAR